MSRPIRVLAIDGGGIRGIIPARLLVELEQLAQQPIADLFDLIIGTSTGGILALGLTAPDARGRPAYPAHEILDLYVHCGATIFSRPRIRPLAHQINRLPLSRRRRGAVEDSGAKYPAHNLEGYLARYLGETRLSQALGHVIVTSYEMETRRPFLFDSAQARHDPAADFLMRDAARATSAAPTFFEPARIACPSGEPLTLVDGGVFANNPAMLGYLEARALSAPRADHEPEILLVSLGTGEESVPFRYEAVKRWGLLSWGRRIMDVVLDGLSDVYHRELEVLLNADQPRPRYWRFQTPLEQCSLDMDDARPMNIVRLVELAEDLLSQRRADLRRVVEHLQAPRALAPRTERRPAVVSERPWLTSPNWLDQVALGQVGAAL